MGDTKRDPDDAGRCQKLAWKDHHKKECGKEGILAQASTLAHDAGDELVLVCRLLQKQRAKPAEVVLHAACCPC